MLLMFCILIGGFLVGRTIRFFAKVERNYSFLEPIIMWTIFLLLFFLGVSIGANKIIISKIGELGLQALSLTLGGILGCLIVASVIYRFFFKDNQKGEYER